MRISSYDDFLTFNPYGWNLLRLTIDQEYKGLRYLKVMNFFKKVSIFTKVDFTLKMDESEFYNIVNILESTFESDVVSIKIFSKVLRSSKIRKQVLNRMLKWTKVQAYQDHDNVVKCITHKQRFKKYEYWVRRMLDLPVDWNFEEDFLDHVDIQ